MITVTQYCPEKKTINETELISDVSSSLAVFDTVTISFLNKVSRLLLSDKNYNRTPEIVALGFWLRRANIEAMQKENEHWIKTTNYSVNPLGKVFHVAPSNVDTIFLYSLCISLLMGNVNIVRVSSSFNSLVVDFIITCINKILAENEFTVLKQYIRIITYEHDETINSFISANVNSRVIWGGDATVLHFRNIPTPVYTKDILFPNRISYSLFKASAYNNLSIEEKKTCAYNFFNDGYTFDQLGCSSPKIIFVLGSKDEKDQFVKELYMHLSPIAEKRYYTQTMLLSSQKYNHLINDAILNKIIHVEHSNNSVYLVEMKDRILTIEFCQGGYFYIKQINEIGELKDMVCEAIQTLSYYGLEPDEIKAVDKSLYGKRIDRIVPVGQALAFHYIWDGMNLFEELSRKRVIELSNNI